MDPKTPQPTLTRTHSGRGWRLPLVAIVVALVALVGLTRLGSSDSPATSSATHGAVLPNPFVPPPPPTPPAPTLPPVIQIPGVMPRSADGLTYADGIPTSIFNQPVHRVTDALREPVGRALFVGGWYHEPVCRTGPGARRCAPDTLSDVPLVQGQGDVRTTFIALNSNLGSVGAHVVLAVVEDDPGCSIFAAGGECQPRLRVLQDVWSDAG